MKNSTNTNLLILDEIFDSSLDRPGTDEFLKILNTLEGENVFVISHKQDVLVDKFKHTLRFEKNKNFSRTISMSKIIKLDEVKKSKKIREKLITEKQELELEIHILQKKLEVIQGISRWYYHLSDDWL